MQRFPSTRLRRNRQAPWIRDLVRENSVSVNDLVYPLFLLPEKSAKQAIKTMPGIYRYGEKELLQEISAAKKLGINAFAIFPVVPDTKKDEKGSYALDKNNFLLKTISVIKDKISDIGIITDVALDPYTSHGHDGVLNKKGYVDNDDTNELLAVQALLLAKAGADYVAPSDMMDGRIGVIREALDQDNFINTGIISYAVKYASGLYSPFRDAVGSGKKLGVKDKKTYQMDFGSVNEAVIEAQMDADEGADILMVKPGMLYLDVVAAVKTATKLPVFAYQVSAEYSMMKQASLSGMINFDNVIMETMSCFKRAGSSAVFTYAAKEIAQILNEK